MSEPRRLNSQATSSSMLTTVAFAPFFLSSSRRSSSLAVCDFPVRSPLTYLENADMRSRKLTGVLHVE